MARQTKLILSALVVFLGAIYFFIRSSTSPSLMDQVSSSLPAYSQWALPPLTQEEKKQIQAIISQKFIFLGEGAQAIAFQSADSKYVLKLFKMRRFTPSLIDQLCPHVVRRRLRNLRWVFNGYKNAYHDLRQETGLVWIHLAKTHDLHQFIAVIDREGKEYQLNLDTTEFVIQEKAELIFKRLERLYKEGKRDEVQKAIVTVLQLIRHRIEKGYADRDKAVSNNYGFIGDRPIQLDIGRLYKGRKEGQLEHVERRIERWRAEHPELKARAL